MTEEPKKYTRDEIDLMTHEGPAYIEHLKKSLAGMRKYKGYMANREDIITDLQEIQRRGFTTHVANGDLRFTCIVYTHKGLGKLLSNGALIATQWEKDLSGPISIFKGYIPYKVGNMAEHKFHWKKVYLYEEVVCITKWFAENRKRSQKFYQNSPEYYALWNELEQVRAEIKRRARYGEPTIWTGVRIN